MHARCFSAVMSAKVSKDFQICQKKTLCTVFILIFSEKWPSIGLLGSHLAKSLIPRDFKSAPRLLPKEISKFVENFCISLLK